MPREQEPEPERRGPLRPGLERERPEQQALERTGPPRLGPVPQALVPEHRTGQLQLEEQREREPVRRMDPRRALELASERDVADQEGPAALVVLAGPWERRL